MTTTISLAAGSTLYKYELITQIGSGGFGSVWLARDNSIYREVAVKILDASAAMIDDRLIEARIGNRLNHPNLVRVHYADVLAHDGANLVIIAMDYHAAGSLYCRLNSRNFLPLPEAVHYMVDILCGLEYLHDLGIFHSDIKPKNILVGSAGEGILSDYGISCPSPSLATVRPRATYLPHIAPEVVMSNQIGVHTDIYQVGLTAFRLLNGIGAVEEKWNRLGENGFLDLVRRGKVVEPKDYEPFVPSKLKVIVNKAINPDPSQRFQSALEMRRALEAVSYPGHWTCNVRGELEGHSDGNLYRFEELPKIGGTFDFTAFKMNKLSGRETKIAAYGGKRLSRAENEKMKKKFIQYVVTGKQ